MPTTSYELTSDETAALDAVLAGPPYPGAAAQVAAAAAALDGLSDTALTRAQAKLDKFTVRQSMLIQSAYSDVLVLRNPSVAVPAGSTLDRQNISGQDTLVVTTP